MRKFLSLLLAACLLAAAVPAAWAAPEGGAVSISSAEDLLDLSRRCALDTWSQGRVITLTADVDLTGVDFRPIPTFGGVFDGQGHTISGLRFVAAGSNQGFFRYLQPGAEVRDLHLSGTVAPEGTRSTVGGVAGVNAGTIQNCSFQGTVRGRSAVGGIAGRNSESGQIISCVSQGDIRGENATGGIAGRNLGLLLKCENDAGVNLTEPGESSSGLQEAGAALENPAALDEEGTYGFASSCADTGGVVGYSSGLVQSCVNRGTVGYPHVGYNTGGIAGRQSGYLAGCVNSGTVQGRKEVGGIVGQAEPYLTVDPGRDALDRLRAELDALDRLIANALDDAQRTGDGVSARLAAMGDYADGARDSVRTLLESAGSLVDENTGAVNTLISDVSNALDRVSPALEDLADAGGRLERLSGHLGQALASLAGAVDLGEGSMEDLRSAAEALRQSGGALSGAGDALRDALEALLKGVVSGGRDAQAAALGRAKTALAELGGVFSDVSEAVEALRAPLLQADDLPAAGEGLPALEELRAELAKTAAALERMGTALPPAPEDWQAARAALRQAAEALDLASSGVSQALAGLKQALENARPASGQLKEALGQLQEVSGASADIGRLLRGAFRTVSGAVDGLTGGGPVQFTPIGTDIREAGDSLYDAMACLSGEMESLNGLLQDGSHTVTEDLRAVSRQFNAVFDALLNVLTDLRDTTDQGVEDLIQDTSDQDVSATREGKVADCRNTGAVEGDRNVGGVAGAMAIEFDLDPEDDATDRFSFGATYETKAVLQNCLNRGSVAAKKDCAGGLVGRMDLGTALECQNYGPVSSAGGDYAGGVAGLAEGSIRACYAKNTLSGSCYVGGIAGWAARMRGCYAIATVTEGTEYMGAIAGDVENGGVLSGNRFVDTGVAGVDGVSYTGRAEPIAFADLRQLPDVPAEFTSFTLTLLAEGETVARIPFFYGDDLSALSLPEVPALEDSYGRWPEFDASGRNSDITLEAVYAPWVTLAASVETEGKLSLALAEGRFTDEAVLHVTRGAEAPPQEGGEVWTVSLTGTDLGAGDAVPLRLLAPDDGVQVQRYQDGRWQTVEAVRNGRYLLLTMEGPQGVFCLRPQAEGGRLALLLAAAALFLTALALWLARRRKKRAARPTGAQAEPAAKR